MTMSSLGRRYAKALLDLAAEQNQADRVQADLADIRKSWDTSPDLRDAFENPSVTTAQRHSVLDAVCDRMGTAALTRNLLRMLSDRRRLRYLPQVIDAYETLAEERAGRVRAEVVTAGAMPDAYFQELARVLEQVTGKRVSLLKRQDPSIIAGVVTRVGDKVFDGSVKTRLAEIRDELQKV
jgi:F-type H+-transporting ATPase subunit delta